MPASPPKRCRGRELAIGAMRLRSFAAAAAAAPATPHGHKAPPLDGPPATPDPLDRPPERIQNPPQTPPGRSLETPSPAAREGLGGAQIVF